MLNDQSCALPCNSIPEVIVFFEKALDGKAHEISYGTSKNSDQIVVTLTVEGLTYSKLSGTLNGPQQNTNDYFDTLKVTLAIVSGPTEWLGRNAKPQGFSVGVNEDQAFIHWKIDSVAIIESIASSLQRSAKLIVRVELGTSDCSFDIPRNSEKISPEVLSLTLSFD